MNTIKKYGRLICTLGLALVVAGACAWIASYGSARYDAGVQAGRNAVLADDARAMQQAEQARGALDAYSAAAGTRLQQNLGAVLPTIQGQTHDTIETIRTIYRDRPVPVDGCSRPDGVQVQLDAAVGRANGTGAAQGGLRQDPTSSGAVHGAAADHGG